LIDRRLDTEWLAALSQEMSQGTILLVGPTQDFDPRIETRPRVAWRPALPDAEGPRLARAAAALLLPYAALPVTRAMPPLTLLDYLAPGKPVIARDLPAVAPWRDALDACDNCENFVARALERLATGTPASQLLARRRLEQESWSAKAEQFLKGQMVRR
jgi:hypothetical protein